MEKPFNIGVFNANFLILLKKEEYYILTFEKFYFVRHTRKPKNVAVAKRYFVVLCLFTR